MRKSTYIHPYPHLRYKSSDALEQYNCLCNYFLTVDDSGFIPTMRWIIWQLKHKDLMKYMKGEYYQTFYRYMVLVPRNQRKHLPKDYRKLIKLIVKNWEKDRELEKLDKEILELKRNYNEGF